MAAVQILNKLRFPPGEVGLDVNLEGHIGGVDCNFGRSYLSRELGCSCHCLGAEPLSVGR